MNGCLSVTVLLVMLLAVVMPVWLVILLGALAPFALLFVVPIWLLLYLLWRLYDHQRGTKPLP